MERRSGIDFYFNKSNEAMCCAYVLRMFVWEDRWLFLVFNDPFRNSVLISIIVLFIKFVYENKTNSEFPNFCSSDQENPGSENLWCCGTQNIYIHQRKDSNAATHSDSGASGLRFGTKGATASIQNLRSISKYWSFPSMYLIFFLI